MTLITLDLVNGNLKIGTLEFTKQTTTEDFLKSEIGQRAKFASKSFAASEYVVADVDIWERKFNNSFWFRGN